MPLSEDGLKALREYPTTSREARLYRQYFRGLQDATWGSPDWRHKNKWAIEKSKTNVCAAVVEAYVSGLSVESFTGSVEEDVAALFMAEQRRVDREAWTTGNGFMTAYVKADGSRGLTYQSSESMVPIVGEDDPELLFVAKVWSTPWGSKDLKEFHWHMKLYYDRTFETYKTSYTSQEVPDEPQAWVLVDEGEHGFSEIPVCWYRLDALSRYTRGRSVLSDLLPVQDRGNKNSADWVSVNDQSSRLLLAVLKDEVERDPLLLVDEDETEEEPLRFTSKDSILEVRARAVQQLQAPSTEAYRTAREAFYGDASAVTGVPEHILRSKEVLNSSFQNTVFLSSRMWSRQKGYVLDNQLELFKAMRLLGLEGRPVYGLESFRPEASVREGMEP